MIDNFCTYLVKKIKGKMPEIDEEKELVIDFGVRLIIGELPKILILFIIGFLLGIGWYTLASFFLLVPYRSSTGGFHLKTHLGCMICTTVLYCLPVVLAMITQNMPAIWHYSILAITCIYSSIVIYKYAPADTENIPILCKKERKAKRIKATVIASILFVIAAFIPNQIVANLILYGMVIQNTTMLPIAYKVTKNKYSYEVYTTEETASTTI